MPTQSDSIRFDRHPSPRVELYPQTSEARGGIEAFIRDCYAKVHGADVTEFMPNLMALRDDQGRVQAALGLRKAESDKLFLEHYLPAPVETMLSLRLDRPVERASVAEVGNLAVSGAGGGRWLITALSAYLLEAKYDWAVFTIGPVLRNSFFRLGLDLIDLGPASIDCLSQAEAARWGNYYAQKPRVMVGRVSDGYKVFRGIGAGQPGLMSVWWQAQRFGSLAA